MFKWWLMMVMVIVSCTAWADVVKVFVDKGSTYVRSEKRALAVGDEVVMASDATGQKPVGKATVMEVTGPLARLALDDEATTAGAKFAALPNKKASTVTPTPAKGEAESAAEKRPTLKGRAEKSLVRLTIYNDSDVDWSDCTLRFPDKRKFEQGDLRAHSDDGILLVKFVGPPDPPLDHLVVHCDQGETSFRFDQPSANGALHGFAEHTGGGNVMVHNTGDVAWSRCDVRKPDGSHYVMPALKGKDHESIRNGLFQKAAVPLTKVTVSCKQGEGDFPL